MIVLLSPAKRLDFTPLEGKWGESEIMFPQQTQELAAVMQKQSPKKIAQLMDLSEALAKLNHERYSNWHFPFHPEESKQALLAFQGDVYIGLDAASLDFMELNWAQDHVRILSGLYGYLRPMDRILPYRLEMGTALKVGRKKNLYEYWGDTLANAIREDLKKAGDLILNVASEEYAKAARLEKTGARVITPQFKDWSNGQYKMLQFFVKKARGMMTRFVIQNQITKAEDILDFNAEGYSYNAELSSPDKPVFTRKK
jgi:cytoplasmic iron level regulating protein YaaA (DUF328/UPF0246 family)